MKEWLQLIDDKLGELLDETPVAMAARYSLFSGGKRLRPLFTLTTATALNAPIDKAIIPACAIELIHTYSMIHDDLPAMDNDDFRRGKPTLHKVHSEAKAILAGDYLLTIAFETIAKADLDTATKVDLIQLIANRSASKGMIGGQWQDIESEKKRLSLEETEKLHHMKTGALIEASILAGAYVAKAPLEIQENLSRFALKIGLA
ncbi:MAG: polyprenyl synthetase family protein, partial [Parachlamydiaceae bacterium]